MISVATRSAMIAKMPPGLCVGDVNADYDVDVLDLLYVIAVWNTDNPAGDINEDGWVDVDGPPGGHRQLG